MGFWNFKLGNWYVLDFVIASLACFAVAWFLEIVLGSILAARQGLAAGVLPAGKFKAGAPEEIIWSLPEQQTFLGKINAFLLQNPWLTQLIERVYYGMGQLAELEPKKMIVKMEKSALIAGIAFTGFCLWAGIGFNPGLVAFGLVIGFFYPYFNYSKLVQKRQRQALLNLTSFVDLLALTIESGLDYLNSMERILATTFKKKGVLEEEIENVQREVQLGYPRRDALRNFAKRIDAAEIRSLVGLLIQSDELGTGLVGLLRSFSQDMRNRRLSKAEELASKASTKMLMPMMLFIFPVIFALILLPFVYSAMTGKGGGLF